MPDEPWPQQMSFSEPKGSLKDTNLRNACDVPYILSFCTPLAPICASKASWSLSLSVPGHLYAPSTSTSPYDAPNSFPLPSLHFSSCNSLLSLRSRHAWIVTQLFPPTMLSIPFLHVALHSIVSPLSLFFLLPSIMRKIPRSLSIYHPTRLQWDKRRRTSC